MARPDRRAWLPLLVAMLAATAASAAEALDPEFLAFLAEEASASTAKTAEQRQNELELAAWLGDWWVPGEDTPAAREEKAK